MKNSSIIKELNQTQKFWVETFPKKNISLDRQNGSNDATGRN